MTVAVKNNNKTPLVVPLAVRRTAGFKSGQELEFNASRGVITIVPKLPGADEEYTPAERRAIDRGIAQSEEDYAAGKSYWPFDTAAEAIASINANLRRRRAAARFVSGMPFLALLSLWLFVPRIDFAQTPVAAPGSTQDRAKGFLDDGLKDKNPDTRVQAVQALGLVGAREPYISQVESMLGDKDVEVRLATVASLVDLENKRTVGVLQKALDDETPEVSFAAAKALWSLNDPSGKAALLSVLSGETKTSSGFITKQKRDALRMIHTPKTMFFFALKNGLAFAPVPGLGAGVSSLQGILSDPSVSGRAATALLLSTDKDPEVLRALQDALGDKDASVRAAAAHAIALRNDPALETGLIPLLDDNKAAVRFRAAAGYLRLEWIKSTPRKPAPRPPAKKPTPAGVHGKN